MQGDQNIKKLRNIIYTQLDSLITGNYCLLDYPNHANIGDHLIWNGELAFLKRFQYKCNYISSFSFFDKKKVSPKDIILMHGGGNFGDLYRPIQAFRLQVVKMFPNQRIIFFPQTVYYSNEALLNDDLIILNKHSNLTICVRDTISYDILKGRLTNANLLLVPDMAFCLNLSYVLKNNQVPKKLFLKRTDKELALQNFTMKNEQHLEILDWPTYQGKLMHILLNIAGVISSKTFSIGLMKQLMNHKTGLLPSYFRDKHVTSGINFINQYTEVYTDRLHGCILAILLNKKVYLIDNNYGKNSSFYNTWMRDFKNLSLLK